MKTLILILAMIVPCRADQFAMWANTENARIQDANDRHEIDVKVARVERDIQIGAEATGPIDFDKWQAERDLEAVRTSLERVATEQEVRDNDALVR